MQAEDLLNSPEYFRCERYRVTMRKQTCVDKRTSDVEPCYDCEQGKGIAKEFGSLQPMEELRHCSKCKEWLPKEDFCRAFSGRLENRCRKCKKEYFRQWYAKRNAKKEGQNMSKPKKQGQNGNNAVVQLKELKAELDEEVSRLRERMQKTVEASQSVTKTIELLEARE